MNNLNEILSAIVDETNFELESREITYRGNSRRLPSQQVSASQLREICSAEEQRVLERSVRGHSPEASMLQLVEALRLALKRFIDPKTDGIGHAFFIEGGSYAMATTESHGAVRDGVFVVAARVRGRTCPGCGNGRCRNGNALAGGVGT